MKVQKVQPPQKKLNLDFGDENIDSNEDMSCDSEQIFKSEKKKISTILNKTQRYFDMDYTPLDFYQTQNMVFVQNDEIIN